MVERMQARLMPMRFKCWQCGSYLRGKVAWRHLAYVYCRRCRAWSAFDWTQPLHEVRELTATEKRNLAETGQPSAHD